MITWIRRPRKCWRNCLLNSEYNFRGPTASDCLMLILCRDNIIWMEAEHTLDGKKLTEELEKMTEVSSHLSSGLRQSSSLKNKSSPLKAASPSSRNSSPISKPTKAETKPSEEVHFAPNRIRTYGRSLRRPSLPPSPGLWPTWQCWERIRYLPCRREVQKGWESLYSHHLCPTYHLSPSDSSANQLLQRF